VSWQQVSVGRHYAGAHCDVHVDGDLLLAAGNSGGDREMLEWAQATGSPSLALLIDHDDAEREFHYTSKGRDVRRDRADHRRRGTPGMDRREHGPRLGRRISAGVRVMPAPAIRGRPLFCAPGHTTDEGR